MKKIAPIALVALMAVAFTSCKKDYTCKCTATVNGQVFATGSTTKSIKDTKKKAKDACNQGDSESTSGGITTKVDCEIE